MTEAAATSVTTQRDTVPTAAGPHQLHPERSRLGRPVHRQGWLVAAILLLAGLLRLPTLAQPLVESFGFRQTQTAYTALLYSRDGIDLMHPKLPVFGTPWEVPFEFPLLQAIASLVMRAGVPPDIAMRATALAFFLLSGYLVYRIGLMLLDRWGATASLVVFVASPFALLWSRASLIEFLATAATLAWFITTHVALRRSGAARWALFGAAVVLGSLAMLTKITTAAWWVVPIAASGLSVWLGTRSRRRAPWGLVPVLVVPLLVAQAWTRHADAVKASSPPTQWLTSDALTAWNFGTLAQRADPGTWLTIVDRGLVMTGAVGAIALLALVVAKPRPNPILWAILATVPLTILSFWNLYAVHDYYLAAVAPAVALGVGAGLAAVAREWAPQRIGAALAVTLLVWGVITTLMHREYATTAFRAVVPPAASAEIQASTAPNEHVVLSGYDWDPTVLYYADRRGFMVRGDEATTEMLAALGGLEDYTLAHVRDPENDPLHSVSVREWAAPLTGQTYRLGDVAEGLPGPVRFSTRANPIEETVSDAALGDDLSCEEVAGQLSSGGPPLLVLVDARPEDRLVVAGLAPIPGTATTAIMDPGNDGIPLECTGDVRFRVVTDSPAASG